MDTHQRAPRQSYFSVAASIVVIVFVGFARTFYLRGVFEGDALPVHLYLHGAVLTAWFAVFFAQVVLIARHRTDVHRRLGWAGLALAVLVITSSLITVALRDAPVIDQYPYAALGNVASVIGFGTLVGSGIWFRRKPAFHRRLMLLSSIQITGPAIDRVAQIPAVSAALDPVLPDSLGPTQIAFAILGTLALLLAVFAYDIRARGRPHVTTVLGTLCVFVVGPALSALLMFSGAWAAFVRVVAT